MVQKVQRRGWQRDRHECCTFERTSTVSHNDFHTPDVQKYIQKSSMQEKKNKGKTPAQKPEKKKEEKSVRGVRKGICVQPPVFVDTTLSEKEKHRSDTNADHRYMVTWYKIRRIFFRVSRFFAMAFLVQIPIVVDKVAWEQGALGRRLIIPRGSLECSSPGGIGTAWEQGAKREHGQQKQRPVKFSHKTRLQIDPTGTTAAVSVLKRRVSYRVWAFSEIFLLFNTGTTRGPHQMPRFLYFILDNNSDVREQGKYWYPG